MMELEILKLIPGGGAMVALMAVVILFLKKQDRSDAAMVDAAAKFAGESAETRKAFQDQLNLIMTQGQSAQKQYQDQIRSIIDDHMIVTRETVGAVRALDATVRAVEVTVRELQTVVRNQQRDRDRKSSSKEGDG